MMKNFRRDGKIHIIYRTDCQHKEKVYNKTMDEMDYFQANNSIPCYCIYICSVQIENIYNARTALTFVLG